MLSELTVFVGGCLPLDYRTGEEEVRARLGQNCDRRADGGCIEKFADVIVLERDTAPGPIAARPTTVDVDVATQSRVLWRRPL